MSTTATPVETPEAAARAADALALAITNARALCPQALASGRLRLLAVGSAKRSPLFPDVPAVAEFAKDERSRQILQLFVAPQSMDRPILAPSGVPGFGIAIDGRAL